MKPKNNVFRHQGRLLHKWHRRIGVFASLFIIWIVISGWMLNHTDSLGMAHHELRNTALARWYGLAVESPSTLFASGDYWITNINNTVILDGRLIEEIKLAAIGFSATKNMLAIASNDTLVLLTLDGNIIDTIDTSILPVTSITRMGTGCNGIAIGNNTLIFASVDGLQWHPCNDTITWSTPQTISKEQLSSIEKLLAPAISMEKLVLDLHSGRFFGRYGAYAVDIIGGCVMLLALSGLWMFFRSNNLQKKRNKARQ